MKWILVRLEPIFIEKRPYEPLLIHMVSISLREWLYLLIHLIIATRMTSSMNEKICKYFCIQRFIFPSRYPIKFQIIPLRKSKSLSCLPTHDFVDKSTAKYCHRVQSLQPIYGEECSSQDESLFLFWVHDTLCTHSADFSRRTTLSFSDNFSKP